MASLGLHSHGTFNKISLQHFSDAGIRGGRETSSQFAALPTSKALAKFRLLLCNSMKTSNGFGQQKKNNNNKKKIIKTVVVEENAEGDGVSAGFDEDDEIPEVVFNRMVKRIGFYVGGPMFLGFTLLPFFDFLKKVLQVDVPLWIPFLTTFFTFGSSALGIVYGAISASWDPEEEGSLLGWTEAQKNWPQIWESDQGQPNKERN